MFPVRTFLVTFLLCLGTVTADLQIGSGIPLPHAEDLERMIKTYIFPNKKNDETFVEYFEKNDMSVDNDTMSLIENLDFSVLDADALRHILKLVKQRERQNTTVATVYRRHQLVGKWVEESPFYDYAGVHIFNRSLNLMRQSIYATRYMIEKTKPIRAMYRSEPVYQMGVLYGYLLELRWKADNCLATMNSFAKYTFKFARFLWLYERLVSIHVDFVDSVHKMFMIQAELNKPTTVIIPSSESSESVEDVDGDGGGDGP